MDGTMVFLSDSFWRVARPGNLMLLTLLAAVAFGWNSWRRLARRLSAIVTGLLLLIAFLPIHAWIGVPLEQRCRPGEELPDTVYGIIMLGGAVQASPRGRPDEVLLNEAAERLVELVRLARRYPNARLVVAGRGESSPATQRLLVDLGLAVDRFVFEQASRNTYENARLARDLVDPAPGENWLLITSAQHLPRAIGVFRHLGWPVLPYPVDFRAEVADTRIVRSSLAENLKQLDGVLHEWVGLLAYRLLGRTGALLPSCEPGIGT